MLTSLLIKDYALIENLTVEFGAGLKIITGETGAGKSILLGALGLILGERAYSEVIRKGASKSIVEAIFDISRHSAVISILRENDIDELEQLIVRREISPKGANRCFINDTPVNLALIKEVGNHLVDIHGQHEHQSLLKVENHISMLDEVGNYGSFLVNYRVIKSGLDSKINELKHLRDKENTLKEKRELYGFQLKEIDEIDPQHGEEDNLEQELKILENAEKLMELSSSIYFKLFEGENSIYDKFVDAQIEIFELSSIDQSMREEEDNANNVVSLIESIAESLRSYRDKIDINPERLEEVRSRLSAFSLLKKKHGGSIERVIEFRNKIIAELETADNFTVKINELSAEIEKLRIECGNAAQVISELRKKTAQSISREIISELKKLGVESAKFEVNFKKQIAGANEVGYIVFDNQNFRADKNGFDFVEFYISTNIGEDPNPLTKVASGGEISRIMLALKSILAKSDKLPLLIFDEIDVGVSGRIAQMVGKSMRELSEFHQIIAITHLPQIAGMADHHYYVEKLQKENRVVSKIRKLGESERVEEIAKLIGGEEVTDAALASARELLDINVN